MALVNKAFSVSVTPGMMPPIVHVSEYDIGRAYTVSIIDEQGNQFTIPSGTTASIEGTLNGKVGFTQSASISNNQVSFTLTESMTAYSGKAWCKIKLTQNSQPIQTCAFVLAVDRAGVEAATVIGAPGFEEQIVNAVNNWLDEHPPASGGMTEEFKQALLDCFENVAWINDDGQTYYDALYAALYPPVDVLSISAVFTQGSAVIYDTDSLNTLRRYLVVTATMMDSTTQTVTDYTLSGTLTVGTSVITVSYGGKTTTFNVTVARGETIPSDYQRVEYLESDGNQVIFTDKKISASADYAKIECGVFKANQATASEVVFGCGGPNKVFMDLYYFSNENSLSAASDGVIRIENPFVYNNVCDVVLEYNTQSPYATLTASANGQTETIEKTDANLSGFNSGHISFFALTDNGSRKIAPASVRLYYINVFDITGEIIHAIPCYRKSDGVIGLYDTVSNTFLTNSGTGAFTKGADVV